MTSNTDQTDDISVPWGDPADAQGTWTFDAMHTPDVMTPLGFDLYWDPFISGFREGISLRYVNYYVFVDWMRPPIPTWTSEEVLKNLAPAWSRWRDKAIPDLQGLFEYYRRTDFDRLSNTALADEIDRLRKTRPRQGRLHSLTLGPWMMAMNLLMDIYKELVGGDDVAAIRLVQGYSNKSVEAGHELWDLSKLAASLPTVRETLMQVTSESALQSLAGLEREPDAEPFLSAFASYLDEYGWRTDLNEMATPTWAEDPTIPLCQLRTYLEMGHYDPKEEMKRLGEERDEAILQAMSSLRPEDRARMDAVLDIATELAPIQEDHNYYIDQRLANIPRRLVLAAGRRLADGTLSDPADVFYLRESEVRSALAGEDSDYADLVGSRRSEMARWASVTPPAFVGTPPPDSEDLHRRFWGEHRLRSDQPNVLPGNGGSAGVATGPARVLMNLGEASRLKRGDVLVARTTLPPWTPLFALTSAIVVETGGILSHAAVTAREYGVPAVLGVTDATRLIRDGQLIEVDGAKGRVRILS